MKKIYLLVVILLIGSYGCVDPTRFATLENRVAAMEMENNRQLTRQNSDKSQVLQHDLNSIEKKLKNGHLLSQEEYARLRYDIRSLKKELQVTQGAIEEAKHQFEEHGRNDHKEITDHLERLDNAISKNYEKVISLEKHMGFEPIVGGVEKTPEPVNPTDTAPATPQQIEQDAYTSAKKKYDEKDMEAARIQFENFITKYPESKNADNARFWIADSYYSEKRYAEAILEYQKVLEQYPDSNKLAAARLKQGYAFAELGENANARLILKELLKKFPDSQEAQYAKEKLKSL